MKTKFGMKCVKCNVTELTKALNEADYSIFKFGAVMKNEYIKEDVKYILDCFKQSNGKEFSIVLEVGLTVMGNCSMCEERCVLITDAAILNFSWNSSKITVNQQQTNHSYTFDYFITRMVQEYSANHCKFELRD